MTTPGWRSARVAMGTASALGLGRFAYGLVLPAMTQQMRWDLAQAGTMTVANGVGYLAGAMATSAVARRLGVTTTFRLGMVLCAVALAATAASANFPALLAFRSLAGFAGALVFIAGAVISPTAIYFAGTGVGIVLGGAAIPVLLEGHAERWPLAWAGLALAACLATAISWTAANSPVAQPATGLRALLPRPLWPVAMAYLLFAAGYIAYITFLSAYLVDRQASTTQTSVVWALLGLAVIASPALWQRPLARWPGERVLVVLLVVVGGAAAVALPRSSAPVVIASAIAYGVSFMAVPAAVTAIVSTACSPEELTGTLATFTVIFATGQLAGPWLAGALADRTIPGATLAWTAALCGIAAILAATGAKSVASVAPTRSR